MATETNSMSASEVANLFNPKHRQGDKFNENYHAVHGNSRLSRVVIIGKDQSFTTKILDEIKKKWDKKVSEITWILEPYRENEDWADIMKKKEATNVLIHTGSLINDQYVYKNLKTAWLIPYVDDGGST